MLMEPSVHVSKIMLDGGKNEREGNIMVGGKPVCDDGSERYGNAVAQVVCRFISFWPKIIINIFLIICNQKFTMKIMFFAKGAWVQWRPIYQRITLRPSLRWLYDGWSQVQGHRGEASRLPSYDRGWLSRERRTGGDLHAENGGSGHPAFPNRHRNER